MGVARWCLPSFAEFCPVPPIGSDFAKITTFPIYQDIATKNLAQAEKRDLPQRSRSAAVKCLLGPPLYFSPTAVA